MEYCNKAVSNLKISKIGFGGAAISGHDYGSVDDQQSISAISAAWDWGVTVFDAADIYGFGKTEEMFVKGLGRNRHKATIVTKFGLRRLDNNDVVKDCSLDWLDKALHTSLRRLKIEQIPIYLIHKHDNKTPLQELAQALQKYKEQGKIGSFGASNFSQSQYDELCSFADASCLQHPFSLINHGHLKQLMKEAEKPNQLNIVFDVLGRGLLTGKYDKNSTFDGADTRSKHSYFVGTNLEKNLKLVNGLTDVARAHKVSPAQVAIKWVLDNSFVDIALVGCKSPKQVEANTNVFSLKLTQEECNLLTKLAD